jgi:hypothetical protein
VVKAAIMGFISDFEQLLLYAPVFFFKNAKMAVKSPIEEKCLYFHWMYMPCLRRGWPGRRGSSARERRGAGKGVEIGANLGRFMKGGVEGRRAIAARKDAGSPAIHRLLSCVYGWYARTDLTAQARPVPAVPDPSQASL